MIKKALFTLTVCILFVLTIHYPVSAAVMKLYISEYGTCRVTAYSGITAVHTELREIPLSQT